MGRGHWWYAQFKDGNKEVTEVKVTNRQDCCGDRLKDTKVYVGRYYCGKLPSSTKTKGEYTVKCAKPVTGNSIIFRQNTTYTALQLALVEVYGNDNCDHDERKNKWGAHKCMSSSDCAGARYCSRWRWCHGKTNCPPKVVTQPRARYVQTLFAKDKECSGLSDEMDRELKLKTAEECAVVAFNDGYDHFVFTNAPGKTNASCKGCKAGTEKTAKVTSGFSIYNLRPNYPVNLQDPADKKKCKVSCDEAAPWDKYLTPKKGCMSRKNVKSISCSVDKHGIIEQVTFNNADGTKVHSHDGYPTCKKYKYEHFNGCVKGNNLKKHTGLTLEQCQAKCAVNKDCKGVDFYTKGSSANGTYKQGDCNEEGSNDIKDCDYMK